MSQTGSEALGAGSASTGDDVSLWDGNEPPGKAEMCLSEKHKHCMQVRGQKEGRKEVRTEVGCFTVGCYRHKGVLQSQIILPIHKNDFEPSYSTIPRL